MKKATAVVIVLLLAGCSSSDEAAKIDDGSSENGVTPLQDDGTAQNPADTTQTVSAGGAPELAQAGLYNEVSIAGNAQVASDCVSQSLAFVDSYGEPQFVNQFYDDTSGDDSGDVIEFNYQCTLRVISFTSQTGTGQCAITGMNVTPEHWGHNPYELIDGC